MNQHLSIELLKFSLEQASCAIIIFDKNARVVYLNREHEHLTGRNRDEMIGMTAIDMIEKKIVTQSSTLEALKKKRTILMEQQSFSKSEGKPFTVIAKAVPYLDDAGNIEYIINYLFDISEKRKQIEELKESNEKYHLELLQYKNETDPDHNIIYNSVAMKKVLKRADIIAKTDSTVSITGNSGVGKSLIARYLHEHGPRFKEAFLTVDCGAIPETLLESELFGYEKGAFTGASTSGKKGLVELANKGTLFLDEIGDMPYNSQIKLLHLIQEKEFYPVGGTVPHKVDTRIIVATNVNLKEKMAQGAFRKDLYYRLNVLELAIPPLSERREDIPALIEYFRQLYNRKYQLQKNFSRDANKLLNALDYPGNVRELSANIEKLILFSESKTISSEDIYNILTFDSESSDMVYSVNDNTYQVLYENFERQIFQQARNMYKTTVSIARHLGINQSTVSRKLKKYNL